MTIKSANERVHNLLAESIDSADLWPAVAGQLQPNTTAMRRMRWVRPLAGITLMGVLAAVLWLTVQPQSVSASEIMARTASGTTLSSYHITSVLSSTTMSSDSTVTYDSWYSAADGSRMRACYDLAPVDITFNSAQLTCSENRADAQYLWILFTQDASAPHVTRIVQDTPDTENDQKATNAQEFQQYMIDVANNDATVTLEGTETVAGREAYVLRLDYTGTSSVTRLWIDSEYYVLLDSTDTLGGITVTAFEINPTLDPAMFTYVPEAGSTVDCVGSLDAPFCVAPNYPSYVALTQYPGAVQWPNARNGSAAFKFATDFNGMQMESYSLPLNTSMEDLHSFYQGLFDNWAESFTTVENRQGIGDEYIDSLATGYWAWTMDRTHAMVYVQRMPHDNTLYVQVQINKSPF